MIAANYFVYLPGGVKRDDAKVRTMADATGLGLYEAKVMIGAPGPRKVGAFAKEEEAQELAVKLRQGGLNAFVVEKARFSRAPKIFKALKAVENEMGLVFSIETAPAPGEVQARVFDLPQPKGLVQAVILAAYTQTNVHGAGGKGSTASRTEVREPVLHLYSEDPHTILEVRGPKFDWAELKKLHGLLGDARWLKMAELFAEYYQAKLDATLFRTPAEVSAITAALNVDAAHGMMAGPGSAASSDDSPVVMAASRIVVYSLVFGL
jgi:hypothetical protein